MIDAADFVMASTANFFLAEGRERGARNPRVATAGVHECR